MADRYWVGGSGSWTDTAKWSTSSGGSGGASVPTSVDNVFFDANSDTGANIDVSNYAGQWVNDFTVNGVGYSVNLSSGGFSSNRIYGDVLWVDPVNWGSANDTPFEFYASAGVSNTINISYPVTFKNVSFTGEAGSSISITAPSGINSRADGGSIYFNGTATTTISLNNSLFFFETNCVVGANVTINAGSATFKQKGYRFGNTNGLTINAACNWVSSTETFLIEAGALTFSSTIGQGTINANGKTFYKISMNKANLCRINGAITLTGGIEVNCQAVSTLSEVNLQVVANGVVVSGPIVVTNTSLGNRWLRISSDTTTFLRRTMTVNTAAHSIVDTYFNNIIINGTAAPLTGTRLANLSNVTGVTFSTPKNVYRIGTGNWNATQWAPTSGGTPDANSYPLPQDTAVFDENTTAGTHTINTTYISGIDMSARTSALTLAGTTAINLYGDWKFGTGITRSFTGAITFAKSGSQTILSNGISFANNMTINEPSAVVELQDAFTNTGTFTLTYGRLNTAGFNFTVPGISSNNTNTRSIAFGSSTVTFTGTSPFTFTNSRNLTIDAGTSTIVCNTVSGFTFAGAGFTYYNVSFSGAAAVGIGISGVNTFNNLSITAPSSAGIKTVSVSNDQTINGTFTISGGAGNQRTLLFSNTLGTTRTLTANAVSFADVDFRDITLAGTAAGSSPTRAGDWGGNTGITFPAPKTVYWNLAGAQNWNADAWAASSGGVPSPDNFPLAQDTAVFNNSGSADTVTLLPTYAISTVNMSARSTAMTITTSTNTVEIYGDWLFGSGVTSSSTTGVLTFVKRGTQTITSNGQTFGCPITIGSGTVITSTVVQLADALTLDSARTLTLTIGTFDAVSYNVTTGAFSTTGDLVRDLKLGSGTWSITGTGTCWNVSATLFTYTVLPSLALYIGSAEIVLSDNTTTARTFNGGSFQYGKVTIGGTSSTSTTTINGNNSFIELASTKTVAHTILFGNNSNQRIKTFSVSGSSGNVVTLDRVSSGVWNLWLFGRTSGIDYLNVNNCTVATTSPAEFYAGANSTDTTGNTRVVFSAAPAARTLYWVGGTGNWSDSARWSLSSGGAGGEVQPTSVDNVVFNSASSATGYTVTIDSSLGARCKTFSMGAPASGNLTWAGTQPMFFHDDVSFPGAANITRTHTGTMYLCGTTSGYTLDPNGLTFGGSIVGYGLDAEWTFLGAVIVAGSSGIYFDYGTLNTNSYNVTGFQFFSSGQNIGKSGFILGSSTITMSGFVAVDIAHNRESGSGRYGRFASRAKLAVFTFDAGTSTIVSTLNGDTTNFFGGNLTWYNLVRQELPTSFGRAFRVWDANTFNNFTTNDRGSHQFLDSGTIISGTLTANGASATARALIESGSKSDLPASSNTPTTLTVNSITTSYCNFRAINLTGAAAPANITSGSDVGYNSGFTFASKTVYRVGTNTSWVGSSSWALTSGGAGSDNNFPSTQDIAVIDDNTALTGTLTVSGGISGLDCSARTIGITLNHGTASTFYGSYILGPGVTLTGTAIQTFSGSGTMVMDPAGKTITFPIVINAPTTSTFQLSGAVTSSSTVTLTQGTLNLNNFNLTSTTFLSNNSNVRTLTFGSGVFTLSSMNVTVWNITTSTNFVINKGTGEIVLSSTSAGTRNFYGGGMSYPKLTIGGTTGSSTLSLTGNNQFTEIASTKTVAHTINSANSRQIVNTWSVTGTLGNVVTLNGNSITDPAFYEITSSTPIQNIDYLTLNSLAFFPVSEVWYMGANSTNGGTLGAIFEAAPAPPAGGTGAMFFMFM